MWSSSDGVGGADDGWEQVEVLNGVVSGIGGVGVVQNCFGYVCRYGIWRGATWEVLVMGY